MFGIGSGVKKEKKEKEQPPAGQHAQQRVEQAVFDGDQLWWGRGLDPGATGWVEDARRFLQQPIQRPIPTTIGGMNSAVAHAWSVLRSFPNLRLCVPHLGADEYEEYGRLVQRYDNLWLDTTMALAGYLPGAAPWSVAEARPGRVMYGTDFPNLPYAWDRELKRVLQRPLKEEEMAQLLGETARAFYGLSPTPASSS